MLEVMGKFYFINVDKIIEKCRPVYTEEEQRENDDAGEQKLEINVFKFEVYKSCLDRVLTEYQEEDEQDVAAFTNKTPNMSFGIAFNTLVKNEILTEDER